MTIRVVIVDDEPLGRAGVRLRLANEPGIVIVGEHGSARAAAEALDADCPDLLFLDVEMPEETGIDLLRRIGPEKVPAVVLVTAHDEHALAAFEVNVVDYVLKPIVEDRFRTAVQRARKRIEEHRAVRVGEQLRELVGQLDTAQANAKPAPVPVEPVKRPRARAFVSTFLVRVGGRERPVSVAQIDWIEAVGDYARLHCGDRSFLVRETMTRLGEMLDGRAFGRIHRSAIVRFDRISSLITVGHGDCEVHLNNGTVLRLSRTYRESFRTALIRSGFSAAPRPGSG